MEEELSNGRVEEAQKEESGVVRKLFEELKSEVLEVEEAVLGEKESSPDEDGERAELVESEKVEEEKEEEELGLVSDPPVEVVSWDMTQDVEVPVEDDLGDTNVVEQEVEEIKDEIFEFKSVGSVAKKGVEETEVQALDLSVAETAEASGKEMTLEASDKEVSLEASDKEVSLDASDKEVSEERDDDSMNPPPAVAEEDVNKDEIITETTRTPPVTSIADRASWRNCCGLFEFLQRNK